MNIQISITEDERDALYSLIFQTVHGDPHGPRRHINSLSEKLEKAGADPYQYHAIICGDDDDPEEYCDPDAVYVELVERS